jgi:hypothetical protein
MSIENSLEDRVPPPELLDFVGEFGTELVLFIPFVNYLVRTGQLGSRVVRTYRGMRPFYEALGVRRIEEKDTLREFVRPEHRPAWLPRRNEHDFDGRGPSSRLIYPDMRSLFAVRPLPGSLTARIQHKPLLVIHNKYNKEWDARPFNHLPLKSLKSAFEALPARFTVVYIRHGKSVAPTTFSDDHNAPREFNDHRLLAQYPDVIDFDRLYDDQREAGIENVNAFKAGLYAQCHFFITSQGGGSQQIAQYSNSLVCIMHRKGHEAKWPYHPGYFTFMTNPAPELLLCADYSDLSKAVEALSCASLVNGRPVLSNAGATLARSLTNADLAGRASAAGLKLTKRRARYAQLNRFLRAAHLPTRALPID